MPLADRLRAGAQAAGDDNPAVLRQCLADRIQRFVDGIVDEAAGVHHDEIGFLVGAGHGIALGAQLGQDALGIDQCLRAAEADEADPGCRAHEILLIATLW